jgi:hypothetical protein
MPAKGQDIYPMQTSVFLAKLIGPILVLAAAGLLLNRKIMDAIAREILGSAVALCLLGLLDFAAGLAIVLTHNVWIADWRVIITILGWLLVIRGALRVLIPDWRVSITYLGWLLVIRAVRRADPGPNQGLRNQGVKNKTAVCVSLGVTLALGAVLCFFGYFHR